MSHWNPDQLSEAALHARDHPVLRKAGQKSHWAVSSIQAGLLTHHESKDQLLFFGVSQPVSKGTTVPS